MINNQKILALITARGGSKGVPRKNVRDVGGKPLIAWTIEAAKNSPSIDRVVLSSDDAEIIEVARQYGCEVPFVRDGHLACDEATSMDVVLDAIAKLPGYDWIMLLQPTTPLRQVEDIESVIKTCAEAGASACVSVRQAEEPPHWMYVAEGNGRIRPLLTDSAINRRQDLPPVYLLNGAIYFIKTETLQREKKFIVSDCVAYEMPLERSVDIDTEADLLLADKFLRKI